MLLAAGGVGLLVTIGAAFAVPHPLGSDVAHAWAWAAVAPLYLVGLLAAVKRPDHLSARWLGAAGSLVAVETVARRLLPQLSDASASWWVAGGVFLQVAVLATTAAIASVLVVFPDGHYRYRYQQRVLWGIWLFVAILPLTLLVSESWLYFPPSWFGPEVANPLFVSALSPLSGVAESAFHWRVVLWVAGSAAMLTRYRGALPEDRRQFRWPLAAAVALTTLDAGYRLLDQVGQVPPALSVRLLFFGLVPGMILLSVSILVALLRHRVIGVDLWLRRAILFGGASAVITLAYLGAAGLIGLAAGQQVSLWVGVLVTLAAVVAFQPLWRRLDRRARRWVFGSTATGSEVLRRVGEMLEDAHDISHLGNNLVRTVVEGLELEWARMSVSVGQEGPIRTVAAVRVEEQGPVVPDLVVPLVHLGSTVGYLQCGPKRNGELTKADEALLTTVGHQAALAVSNVQLTAELESRLINLGRQAQELAASRNRIVQAQMEERRRIERNIHDGVQQEIIASIAKIRLARNQLTRDPALTEATLAGLQEDTRRMLNNLRELSRGIHPPVLTHRGLVEALRTQAGQLPIDVQVEIAPKVRGVRFPDEVEETAFYVVSEGLTNVLKHAATPQARVRLDGADGQLTVEVIDGGRGFDPESPPGSGIVGLRDRLAAIGGDVHIDSRPGAGTILRAVLPTHPPTNVAEQHD